MELRHLRYFVAVAEELHFGHAASRLHVSQPSLSQQVQNLERELTVDLFRRTKRRVELTRAGRRFLLEARGILAAAERASGLARETARDEARRLVLGISQDTDWVFLGKVLRLFAERVPFVDVVFQNLAAEAQVDALRRGHVDVGFVGLPLEADGVVTEVTGRVRLVVALPEKHPMARVTPLKLEDLSKEAYMLWPRHLSPGSYDHLLSIFRLSGFGLPIAIEGGIPSTRTVLGMVAAALTIALVDPLLQQMGAPGVVFRSLAGPGVFTETGIIFRRGDPSPVVASFIQELMAVPREHPASREEEPIRKSGRVRPIRARRKA